MTIGVYWIYQVSKDRAVYVGSSRNVEQRLSVHKSYLRHNKHRNEHLQLTWNKYGASDFQFMPLETCHVDQLIEREEFWMHAMPTFPTCNNTRFGSAVAHSDESKRKISISATGRHHTEEARKRIGDALRGKKRPEEIGRKISAALKGRPLTAETRRKLSEANKGKTESEETRRKKSEALKGKTTHMKGKRQSAETIRKKVAGLKRWRDRMNGKNETPDD